MTDKELTDFIDHGENGFVEFALTFGNGWAGQAIEIAKELRAALAQPEKEWVGLTDEDRVACEQLAKGNYVALCAAIEAKLKEKNATT
jgi:hypothetical protein